MTVGALSTRVLANIFTHELRVGQGTTMIFTIGDTALGSDSKNSKIATERFKQLRDIHSCIINEKTTFENERIRTISETFEKYCKLTPLEMLKLGRDLTKPGQNFLLSARM